MDVASRYAQRLWLESKEQEVGSDSDDDDDDDDADGGHEDAQAEASPKQPQVQSFSLLFSTRQRRRLEEARPRFGLSFRKDPGEKCGLMLGSSKGTRGVIIRIVSADSLLFGKLAEGTAILAINGAPVTLGAEATAKALVEAGPEVELTLQAKATTRGKTDPVIPSTPRTAGRDSHRTASRRRRRKSVHDDLREITKSMQAASVSSET